MIAAASSSIASSSSTLNSNEPLEYFHSQLKSIKLNNLNVNKHDLTNNSSILNYNNNQNNNTNSNSLNNSDFGAYFVKKLIPHVKSFAYTWFHLQAAKRKHFKNEDKRMNYEDEQQLKQRLMNEAPSVKIKWAVRLLMKLRKDIQKMYQKELVDIIASKDSALLDSNNSNACKCVVSNPDMKGKMRRIDCLRQSDKVWRLDLVMVVLFKGIPLESSDGERLDKLTECTYPQLCINPNHALLNVRDLEVYLANYIKNQSNLHNDIKLECYKNIVSPSVFTSSEFLTLSNVTILDGATDTDLKSSLNIVTSSANSHYSDDNEEVENNNKQLIQHNTVLNDELDEKGTVLKKIVQLQQNTNEQSLFNDNNNENIIQNQQYFLIQNQSNKRSLEHLEQSNNNNSDNENINNLNEDGSPMSKQNSAVSTPKKKKTKANKEDQKNEKGKQNLNINEIIEQMKQNDNNTDSMCNKNILSNTNQSIINTADFELRLINESNSPSISNSKQAAKVTKPRKNAKKDKEDQDSKCAVNSNDCESKPIVKRRKSAQKQTNDQVQDQISTLNSTTLKADTNRSRKSASSKSVKNKLNNEEFKLEEEETSVNINSQTNNTNTINLSTIEDHSSCSTSSQQDEEIKELLMRKNDSMNSFSGIIVNNNIENNASNSGHMSRILQQSDKSKTLKNSKLNTGVSEDSKNNNSNNLDSQQPATTSPSISFANKIIADELKELIQKEKQTTADLFLQLQLLKNKEDQINTNNFVNNFSNSISYMHQNSNSSDISLSELSNINKDNANNLNQQHQQFNQRIKSATPVFVDQLLMSPLFNSFMPSCGSSSSSNSSSSTNTNTNQLMQQTNSVVTSFSQMAAAVSAVLNNTNNNSNKSTPSSSPTINLESGLIKINSNQSSFKRTKENIKNSHNNGISSINKTNKSNNNINSSCINALRFDTNSNGSYDELINLSNQTNDNSTNNSANQQSNSFSNTIKGSKIYGNNRNSPLNRSKIGENSANRYINRGISGSQTPRNGENMENEYHVNNSSTNHQENNEIDGNDHRLQQNRIQTTPTISSSPPPPPPIGSTVVAAAPSPTKLPQFYHYSAPTNSHTMHRPIPILQKADAALSSLINNLTSSSSLINQSTQANNSDLKLTVKNNSGSSSNVNNSNNNNTNSNNENMIMNENHNDSHNILNKTPTCDLNELIKINSQQQLISSLRSNSISNNSPLMFNNHFGMNFNSNNSINNNLLSSYASNSGTNIFSNYPNISPANGMNGAMMGGNGNGSPTSNLFPSITSLFQSPIGTPRVTPTPQHFAAYLFNEDHFNSLIFPSSSLLSNGGLNSDQALFESVLSNTNSLLSSQCASSGMIVNFTNNESNSNLSPLPTFNNFISNSLNNLNNNSTNSHSASSNQSSNETILNEANQKQNSNNLLSAKD